MIELPRRKFLSGLAALIAAPAIVRASSLMPVRGYDSMAAVRHYYETHYNDDIMDVLITTRRAFVPRLFVQVYKEDDTLSFLLPAAR